MLYLMVVLDLELHQQSLFQEVEEQEQLVLHLSVLIIHKDLMKLKVSLLLIQVKIILLNQLLQYLIQKHLVVLELIILMKLFKVCVQEHKQELKIGIMILVYLKLAMLVSVQQRQDSFQVKMLKDWNLEQCSVFLCSLMTPPINIMKEIYLNQRQIY